MNEEKSELRKHIPSWLQVAHTVDHPVILEGPDALVGGEGHLISLFYLKKNRSLNNLRARVAASKLALPSHCLHVLIVDPTELSHKTISETQQVFHRVAEVTDLSSASLIRGTPSESARRELGHIKKKQAALYARTFRFADARRRYQRNDGSSSRIAKLLREGRPRNESTIKYKGLELSAREQPATLTYLKQLCQQRFSRYIFDNAVPYPISHSPGIAVSDTIPEYKNDPEKPLRAASFSGWIVTDATSIEDLNAIIDRAERFGFEIGWAHTNTESIQSAHCLRGLN